MNILNIETELSQLPDQIYQARCAALEIEQRALAAAHEHEQMRTTYYLAACAAGDGHYTATGSAAVAPEVVAARDSRERLEVECKRATAMHGWCRDRLRVLLHLQVADASLLAQR